VFGYRAYAKELSHVNKLANRSCIGVFIGHVEGTKAYRVLFVLAAQERWHVHHMDVKSTFLNGKLMKEVYVRQPARFVIADQEGKVLMLKKALYNLQ
jgi:hypothetical protein